MDMRIKILPLLLLFSGSIFADANSDLLEAQKYILQMSELQGQKTLNLREQKFSNDLQSSSIAKNSLYEMLDKMPYENISETEIALIIQDLSDRTRTLKSTQEKTLACLVAKKYFAKLPPRFSLGKDNFGNEIVGNFSAEDDWLAIGTSREFPEVLVNPKHSVLEELSSPYKIKTRFDKDRDGALSDSEISQMLLEEHYLFSRAKNIHEREKILSAYGKVLDSQNISEFEVNWGENSSFKVAKNPDTNKWQALYESEIVKSEIGKHASYKFAKLSQERISTLAYLKTIDELCRTNVFERAQKMQKLLTELEKSSAKEISSNDKSAMMECAKMGLFPREYYAISLNFVEYINENLETVIVPIFESDAKNTREEIAIFSQANFDNLSESERKDLRKFYEKVRKE